MQETRENTPIALVRKHAEFRSSENSGYDLRKIILTEVSEFTTCELMMYFLKSSTPPHTVENEICVGVCVRL